MITVNALGDTCPIPVVKTKKAIAALAASEQVETLVDNEIAVQNLTKMAEQSGYPVHSSRLSEGIYSVIMDVTVVSAPETETKAAPLMSAENDTSTSSGANSNAATAAVSHAAGAGSAQASGLDTVVKGSADTSNMSQPAATGAEMTCFPDAREHTVIVISSRTMGSGDDALGAILMKGFLYAITQQETLPETILFYNGGAFLTTEGSASIEDLRSLEAQGVEILTCGTCLNHYGLADQLLVGDVTNMYVIAEKMTKAGKVIRP